MRLGELRVDLQRILEFDGRLAVLSLFEVRAAFVEGLLFADLRVGGAASRQS
jgi:hypothetical protein